MSFITNGIFIGDYMDAGDLEFLQLNGITHILCAAGELQAAFPTQFKYKCFHDASDDVMFNMAKYFDEAADFINRALNSGGKVLVHCYAGICRSTTSAIAYLIKYRKMTLKESLALCKRGRPITCPNSGFMRQLEQYEYQNLGGGKRNKSLGYISPTKRSTAWEDEDEYYEHPWSSIRSKAPLYNSTYRPEAAGSRSIIKPRRTPR